MKNHRLYHRKSIRLKGYDYSKKGRYYITICCKDKKCLFGKIVANKIILNDAGKMVNQEWLKMPERFQNIILHEFVVMPNHFHGIIEILSVGATLVVALDEVLKKDVECSLDNDVSGNVEIEDEINVDQNKKFKIKNSKIPQGHPQGNAPTKITIGDMVGAFKSITTVEYIDGVKKLNWPRFNRKLWQRNYHEHIIRDELSFRRITNYIKTNPENWKNDEFYIK